MTTKAQEILDAAAAFCAAETGMKNAISERAAANLSLREAEARMEAAGDHLRAARAAMESAARSQADETTPGN